MNSDTHVDPELRGNFEPLRVVFAVTAVVLGLILAAI